MPKPASWYRTSERHLAVDLGRIGSVTVWREAGACTWSLFALGVTRGGFLSAAAQTAGLRLARAQLEGSLRRIGELEAVAEPARA